MPEQEIDLMKRDGFRQTMEHHVEHYNEDTRTIEKKPVKFTQWEAKYVGELKYENVMLKNENRALLQLLKDMEDRHMKSMQHLAARKREDV